METDEISRLKKRLDEADLFDKDKPDAIAIAHDFDLEFLSKCLIDLISTEDFRSNLVGSAMKILFWVNRPSLATTLETRLTSADPEVRSTICYVVGSLKLTELQGALESTILEDMDADVRYWAAVALGEIGDVNSLAVLAKAFDDHDHSEMWHTVSEGAKQASEDVKLRLGLPMRLGTKL